MNQKVIIGILIIVVFTGFWGLVDPPRWYMYMCLLPCFLSALISVHGKNISNFIGRRILWTFLIAIIPNLFFSYLNRHQNPIDVLRNSEFLDYLYFFSFFIFAALSLSIKDLEKILKVCYWLFLFCFFLEYFVFFPSPVFKFTSATDFEHRFRMVGQLIGFIGYFYYLNRALVSKNNRPQNIIASFCGLLFIFLLGFRTHIVATMLASMYLIFRIDSLSLKFGAYLAGFAIGIIMISYTETGQNVITKILERQETQVLSNDDYIRIAQWGYFTNEHFISTTDYIFGSGLPSGNNSYSRSMEVRIKSDTTANYLSLAPTQWRDWGLLGLSWVMGIPLFLVLLVYIGYMIVKKVPNQYLFISSFYLEIIISGFSTIEFYREGAFVFHGLMLCLIYQIIHKEKLIERSNSLTSLTKFRSLQLIKK